MIVARKGASSARRRIYDRHLQSLVRSVRSSSSQHNYNYNGGVRYIASQHILEGLANQNNSETESKEIPSHEQFCRLKFNKGGPNEFASIQPDHQHNHRQSMASIRANNDAPDPLRNAILSGSLSASSWNLVRSTMTSSSSHRTLFFDPLNSSLGLSSHGASYNSRMHFSTKAPRKRSADGSYSTSVKIPTPKSESPNSLNPFASIDIQALLQKAIAMTWSVTKTILKFLIRLPGNSFYFLTHPKERQEKIVGIKDAVKHEVDHYWMGSKLLMADVRTARSLLARTMSGSTLTRRERTQLLRTVSDLFRLVPMSMFLLIPFMEFALPFALKIFPNMLPSTFQDSLKAEENMKRELQSRIAMVQFFQETMEELAKEQKRIAGKRDGEIATKQEESAVNLLQFLERARNGEMMPPDVIVQYANYFQDDLTLDNMPRMQLINMCKYMSIPPYGAESFLRFQLRHKIRILKEDDQRILWEGIESLTKMELREACQERGMRSTGLSKVAYRRSLQQWLDLSVNKNVPVSLLIMSRIFFLQEEMIAPALGDDTSSVAGLADAISGLDKEVLNEVILEVATSEEKKSDPDVRKIKLEVLTHQNEKIKEEQAEREAAGKKKKSAEKIEAEVVPESLEAAPADLSLEGSTEFTKAVESKSESDKIEYVVLKAEVVDIKGTEEKSDETPEEDKTEHELSAEEMEALSQLLSADAVSKERLELAKIKSAMKEQDEETELNEEFSDVSNEQNAAGYREEENVFREEPIVQGGEQYAASLIDVVEKQAAAEADESTVFTTESELLSSSTKPGAVREETIIVVNPEEEGELDAPEDPVVARLKKRLESMVDKIEGQLSDVQVKIGDKLHILDKDMDGILSREEMADCLQQVLKRKITFEEAMEIASGMDENEDGVFTVQELIKWIETNKLVKLESEGRDADMDRIMESHSQKDEQAQAQAQAQSNGESAIQGKRGEESAKQIP